MEKKNRLVAIDWLRGFIMVLMAIDHASHAFNSGRLVTDTVFLYNPGMVLPGDQFFVRWVTHICAPGFLFLAGISLSLSTEKRLAKGENAKELNRHMRLRGILLIAFDMLWMSLLVDGILLQVLYAIGLSFILMTFLHHLPNKQLWIIALAIILGSELVCGIVLKTIGGNVVLSLLLSGGFHSYLFVLYPVLPWLAMMIIGWIVGRSILSEGLGSQKIFIAGMISLGVFFIVRWINSYGNFLLLRDDFSVIQWLHVSKYPPSITFVALELGLVAILLSLFLSLEKKQFFLILLKPLQILGQTALFFYLLHMHALVWTSQMLGLHRKEGLTTTFIAALAVVVILLPLCYFYSKIKHKYPDTLLRYI